MGLRTWLSRVLGQAQTAEIVETASTIRHGVDRRTFLRGALLGTVAAATLDVEQLLWTPKAQIVVPGPVTLATEEQVTETLANLFDAQEQRRVTGMVTPQWVTQEALRLLKNRLTFTPLLIASGPMGHVAYVRKPQKFVVLKEHAFDAAQVVFEQEAVPLDDQVAVQFQMPRADLPMSRPMFSRAFIEPAVAALAHHMAKRKMNVIGKMPDDMLGVAYAGTASDDTLSVRGILGPVLYGPAPSYDVFRLDVLGGHSTVLAAEQRDRDESQADRDFVLKERW